MRKLYVLIPNIVKTSTKVLLRECNNIIYCSYFQYITIKHHIIHYNAVQYGQKFGTGPVGIKLGENSPDPNFLPSLAPTNHPSVLVDISIFFT